MCKIAHKNVKKKLLLETIFIEIAEKQELLRDRDVEEGVGVGCTHIQKFFRSSCNGSTARRHEFHGQNGFYPVKFRSSSVILPPKTFSLFSSILQEGRGNRIR